MGSKFCFVQYVKWGAGVFGCDRILKKDYQRDVCLVHGQPILNSLDKILFR